MKRLIDLIFSRRNLVIMLFIIILGFGVYSYFVIPKQEMPEIDTPYMTLSITAPGVSATYIEAEIIEDIEKVVLTFSDVTEVRSYVFDNYAISYILYNYSADDPDQTTLDIFSKVNELELDDSISNLEFDSGFDDPHIIFSIHSENLSQTELEAYALEYKNDLITIDEISTVSIDNAFLEEVVIELDLTTLALYQLTITDIYQILYANSLNIPLGGISTAYGTISISGNITFDELSDLENLIIIPEIPTVTTEVTLGDLSIITLEDTSLKEYTFNDEKTIFLSVFFEEDIDFTKMGDEVLELKQAFLTEQDDSELAISEMLFLPDYVNDQINNVFYSLLSAIGVVMLVVLIGIGFRNSLLIISTIPVIIFGTIGILYLADYELHKLTIVGLIIAIGILVDNSIVITEGIKRNIDKGMDKVEGAKKAIYDNFAPILSSTLTTIAAFIVLVLLPGFLGEVVNSMPLTVIITITLSYIVSMVLSPVIAVLFLKPRKVKDRPKSGIHERRIKKMISTTIRFPALWIVISIAGLIASAYFTFQNQPLDLYPNDERSIIYIDYENNVLGDFESTKLLSTEIIKTFKDNPDVISYASSVGGDLPNFHFSAELISNLSHFGRIYLNCDLNEEELLDYVIELENEFQDFTDGKITVNILELSPPIAPVRVTVSGDNITKVDEISATLFTEISELDNVKSYSSTVNQQAPKFNIAYDQTIMSNMFITKVQIDQVIALNLNGFDLNVFEYNEDTINISINSDIDQVTDLLALTVYSETLNQHIPLSTFITITEVVDYSVIYRYNNENVSFIDLYFTNDSSIPELEKDVKAIVDNTNTTGVTITYGGENELFTEISGDLIRASIIAIVLIYIIMYIQFNNFIKPLIVFVTIPLSFTGSFLFMLIFDTPITATGLVGMVSLLGVTVNTGILLVEYITRHHKNGEDVKDACVEAVFLRFRPIMLTSFTTILGLIPLFLTGGNFFRPLAITFMGGMVTSTLITIFLVPSIYSLIYSKKRKSA
ncbi:Efflux pump membrane transporter BepE [Candidatus Izimaplasma bacterium HR1]|uniref:efflux RND transporter permease subunit n=1 Tax=Candidatus Izimoplasma sp. HR1 TaxID=1541959 RepID=UPI0004F8288D|nr:Efflux pump membrane transporter BepE [Candidatus Izimaplasma bacterium HR1]